MKTEDASFTTEIDIFHNDGTLLAKAKGTQLYPTTAGAKAGVTLRHPDKMTVCEMNGTPLFELTRLNAVALKGTAELFTPDGSFVKVNDSGIGGFILDQKNDSHLDINGITMSGNRFEDSQVGIIIRSSDYLDAPNASVPQPHFTRSSIRTSH